MNGKLHRIDGPAIIDGDDEHYWINGNPWSPEMIKFYMKNRPLSDKKRYEMIMRFM